VIGVVGFNWYKVKGGLGVVLLAVIKREGGNLVISGRVGKDGKRDISQYQYIPKISFIRCVNLTAVF